MGPESAGSWGLGRIAAEVVSTDPMAVTTEGRVSLTPISCPGNRTASSAGERVLERCMPSPEANWSWLNDDASLGSDVLATDSVVSPPLTGSAPSGVLVVPIVPLAELAGLVELRGVIIIFYPKPCWPPV